MTNPVDGAIDALRSLIELETEKIRLSNELLRCLLVAQLLNVPPKEMGRVRHGVYDAEHRTLQRWRGMVLRVTREGETTDFPLTKVPPELWPADVLAEYRRYLMRNQQRREMR